MPSCSSAWRRCWVAIAVVASWPSSRVGALVSLPVASSRHRRRVAARQCPPLAAVTQVVAAPPTTGLSLPVVLPAEDTAETAEAVAAPATFRPRIAPPMTVEKFQTMQAKRVRLYVCYSGGERHAIKVFQRIQQLVRTTFPDVIVEKRIRRVRSTRDTGKFEILVDDRLVYSKPPERDGIFLSMRALAAAIVRARRLRRPGQTVYGDRGSGQGSTAYLTRD